MGKILAFDYGTKRIGLAETDDLKIIASPLETVENEKIFDYLKKYLTNNKLEAFVVGMPINTRGEATHATKDVEQFIVKLNKIYPTISVFQVDERFTSKMAFQAMIDGGLKKKKRRDKSIVDKVSAAIILQSYLESKQY